MSIPNLGPRFFMVLAALWAAFAYPSYLYVEESTSISTAAAREAKLVKATIRRELFTRGSRKFDVAFPRTYGLSSCYVLTSSEVVGTWTSAEIDLYVIPDTPARCALSRPVPEGAPRERYKLVLESSVLSLLVALAITSGIWWIVLRRRARHF